LKPKEELHDLDSSESHIAHRAVLIVVKVLTATLANKLIEEKDAIHSNGK